MGICSSGPTSVENPSSGPVDIESEDGPPLDIISLESEINDVRFIRELICEMKDDIGVKMISLRSSLLVSDFDRVIIAAHSIKGIALSMKCNHIAKSSSRVEQICIGLSRGSPGVEKPDLCKEMLNLNTAVEEFYAFHAEYMHKNHVISGA